MKVRFTRPALADLEAIHSHIAQENGDTVIASRVVYRLIERAQTLREMPLRGRETDEPGVRVLIVPRLRFLVFYTVEDDVVLITHIRHSARIHPLWR